MQQKGYTMKVATKDILKYFTIYTNFEIFQNSLGII